MEIPPLAAFGRRIMICGPSNAGKSTLAQAIGRKLGIEAVHLDRFRHLPNTDYVPRGDDEFTHLHDEAILGDSWAMDGNYSTLFPPRVARATGVILLGDNRWTSLARYFRRTLFERRRAGALEGNRDSVKWEMIHWIVVVSPGNLRRYRIELSQTGLPFIEAHGMRQLRQVYAAWELQTP
ncbi:MAG: AAA family ATPase [Devosia sp.]|nr:AAA family ATPase [Devosia sp.]